MAEYVSAASYVFPLLGVSVLWVTKKGENESLRLHALQAVLLGLMLFVIQLIIGLLVAISQTLIILSMSQPILAALGAIFAGLAGIVAIIGAIAWLVWIIYALACGLRVLKGDEFSIPFITGFAQNFLKNWAGFK